MHTFILKKVLLGEKNVMSLSMILIDFCGLT